MLVAQLIAAKINTYNAAGVGLVQTVDDFLCEQGVVYQSNNDWVVEYNKPFPDKEVKRIAVMLKDELDGYNNYYDCDGNYSGPQ